ncbi:transglutaminase-like domain-containing protein [Alicyclobacillus fodiniaquatilis]|uniref:Transglutaminase family protein n=1 Tax=Alicyclobacillus fodiniaquatilis TaxID=1661150 RepID=A0ABW4JBG7_9BACL
MAELQTKAPLDWYLRSTQMIDVDHEEIHRFISSCNYEGKDEINIIRDTFEFVRDQVSHSYDVKGHRVTAKASEALLDREGICYAKSHLLAALLRGMGIPTGVCYQKLTLGDTPDTGYCIHALNTVYLAPQDRWIRLDARGNKPGVDAQFSLSEEKLAFDVRPHYGEIDYLTNHYDAHPQIVQTLENHKESDALEMYLYHLPTDL